MTSSMFGIYNAQRALLTNQAAMNLISTNISNINTPGYSKQRLELSPGTTLTSEADTPLVAAQSGMGAVIDDISRNRSTYLDNSYRDENSKLSYYTELNSNVSSMEDITNELGDATGIGQSFNDFYNSAQQLSINPTDSVTKNDFVQKSIDLCDKFNQDYSRLTQLRTGLVGDISNPASLDTSKIKISCDDLNTQLKTIADLNHTISLATAQGTTPNSLLDQRDELIDKISSYIPVNVTTESNNLVTLSLGSTDLVKGVDQVGFFKVVAGDASNPATVKILDSDNNDVVSNANSLITAGSIGALLEIGGSDPTKATISGILGSLNNLALDFAKKVNAIQEQGQYINTADQLTPVTSSLGPPPVTFDLFVNNTSSSIADYTNLTAGNITVNQDIMNNPYKIATASAASAPEETGDGSNILQMAQLRNQKSAALGNSTTEEYLYAISGKLGVQIKTIQDKQESQSSIVDQITQKKESATGVNLDEELTDLVRFQRSYEASAKVLTAMDQILQKIINMGQ